MPDRQRRPPALHLVWVIPAVVALSVVPFIVAALSWCGISGCAGGGWGRNIDDTWMAIGACCIAAALEKLTGVRVPIGALLAREVPKHLRLRAL